MSDVREVRFEYLRPHQLRDARERADIAFLPLGALEWHGLHNALGLDGVKAHGVCVRAAQKLGGGVVFPPLFWGVPRDSFYMDTFGGDLTPRIAAAYGIAPETIIGDTPHGGLDRQEQWLHYQRLIRMSLEQIAGFGFRSIYMCTGHAPLVTFAAPAAKAFTRATKMAGRTVTVDWGGEGEAAGLITDHAGEWETSLMMALAPETVDLTELGRHPDYIGVGAGRNAVGATTAQGEAWLEACTDGIVAEARWLIENYPAAPVRQNHER